MLIGYMIFLIERKEKMNANFIVVNNDYTDDGGLYERLFLYITRADKTEHGFIGAYGIYLGYGVEDVTRQMREVCLLNSNQERSLWHFILSFDHFYDYWVTPDIAYTIARQFVIFFEGYQTVYAVHEDTNNVHVHFMVNATNFYTGKKFENKRETFEHIAAMCPAVIVLNTPYGQTRLACRVFYHDEEDLIIKNNN